MPKARKEEVRVQCNICKTWMNKKSLSKHSRSKKCNVRNRNRAPVVPEEHRGGSMVPVVPAARNQRGQPDPVVDGNEPNLPSQRRGQNFALSFSCRFKYKVSQRLLTPRMEFSTEEVTSLVISDEAGGGYMPNVHSHAYVKTKEKYNFEEFSNLWVIQLQLPGFTDVQSPKKIKDWIKYITKEDYRSIAVGVDKDLLGTICKSYICAQKWVKIMPTLPPYCYLSWVDRKIFDTQFAEFRREFQEDKLVYDLNNAILYDWQIEVLRMLDSQDDRKVLWIYDAVGGEGKTFLAKYIQLYRDCICLESGKKTDLAHCFTNETYVLFDYTRSMEETINYSIVENFKNGFLFSGKYDSKVKKFDPCKVCCFSNFSPDKSKLPFYENG
ncbi:Hypothetical predicted protein [Mytilus galloprovincialis]|uniref:Uncharacterized protein n=1 Tax=Mytilus galloprovincialis TaxID=29158 RepID=A0A8B6E500_MYTGA|nr:Hypothetical predicted protein [Mytilus galloprovincialis]